MSYKDLRENEILIFIETNVKELNINGSFMDQKDIELL